MIQKTLLSLLGAASTLALVTACGTTSSPVGSVGEAVGGDPCAEAGATARSVDGCNSCTCTDGAWVCTDVACADECSDGDTQPAGDGCNTCTCQDGQWGCTLMYCSDPVTCTEGETKVADDGCNTCTCAADGTWACTEVACVDPVTCTEGETKPADDGCNTCSCTANGEWVCTAMACIDPVTCTEGETKVADDGCNTCTCTADGTWACTEVACVDPVCPDPRTPDPGVACPDVIVWAQDPASGLCCQYSDPCAAPADWEQFYSSAECEADASGSFTCGTTTCTVGEEYCSTMVGGTPDSGTSSSCTALPTDCTTCACLGSTAGCDCTDTDGAVRVTCYAP